MGDRSLPLKPEEQYPLLKVDCGGDSNVNTQAMPTAASGWSITCTKKQSWLSKWPEFISAVWMSLILFGISFLVFYAIGMGVYRRQQLVIVKCNTSRPASNVFYHHIVPRGGQITFIQYMEYLSQMARNYPKLHFNVFFLVDDSYPSGRGARHARFINKFIPYYPYGIYSYKLDEANKQALFDFQRRYQNMNISIIPLSKYMALTPLRFRWKIIPLSFLAFYARVFSVWENGGIGMDLVEFNNKFNSHYQHDRRIATILQQHNDGINPQEYTNALNKIDKDEQTAIFSMFYGIINQFLNETKSFINRTLSFPMTSMEKTISEPLIRNRRSINDSAFTNSSEVKPVNLDTVSYNNQEVNNTSSLKIVNTPYFADKDEKEHVSNETNIKVVSNNTEPSKIVLFYDFSVFSDSIGPSYIISEPMTVSFGPQKNRKSDKHVNYPKPSAHLLSLDGEGTFVSASTKLHPFLGHVITMGCQRMQPKLAIQEAIISQCSGILKNDIYCNNIYIL